MTRSTYDEIRAAAVPCHGGCGRLVTVAVLGRYVCERCRRQEWTAAAADILRRGQPDSHEGGME